MLISKQSLEIKKNIAVLQIVFEATLVFKCIQNVLANFQFVFETPNNKQSSSWSSLETHFQLFAEKIDYLLESNYFLSKDNQTATFFRRCVAYQMMMFDFNIKAVYKLFMLNLQSFYWKLHRQYCLKKTHYSDHLETNCKHVTILYVCILIYYFVKCAWSNKTYNTIT